jgi:hypothetical protein
MRYITVFILININLFATDVLMQKCIQCHINQKIPSDMIYRKYLLRYSTSQNISQAIYNYIKAPSPKTSIMPKPFFDKFPLKPQLAIEEGELKELIDLYIKKYDLKNRLSLR